MEDDGKRTRAASDHRMKATGEEAAVREKAVPPAVVMPLVAATPWAYQPVPLSLSTKGAPGAAQTPQWLRDLQQGNWWKGSYHEEDTFAAFFTERGSGRLFVTFDANALTSRPHQAPYLWAHEVCRKNDWSQLDMLTFRPNWYRDEAVFAYLSGLAETGFFARFDHVVFAGLSMGGYAACAFSGLVPGSHVVAFSPQSSLARDVVGWDRRFPAATAVDWSGPYRDAADHIGKARQVHLIYDPREAGDRQHAARLDGPNVTHLHTRYAGHKSSIRLLQARILDAAVERVVEGKGDPAAFRNLYRQVRLHPWYLDAIGQILRRKRHAALIRRVANFAMSGNRPVIARGLQAMAEDISRQLIGKARND